MERARDLVQRCGDRMAVYSGEDPTALGLMLAGGKGAISVTANVAPRLMAQMCEAAVAGNRGLAEQLDEQLMPLHQNLFLESNPIPAKWALYEMGLVEDGIRLPLTPLSNEYRPVLREAMAQVGVI